MNTQLFKPNNKNIKIYYPFIGYQEDIKMTNKNLFEKVEQELKSAIAKQLLDASKEKPNTKEHAKLRDELKTHFQAIHDIIEESEFQNHIHFLSLLVIDGKNEGGLSLLTNGNMLRIAEQITGNEELDTLKEAIDFIDCINSIKEGVAND